MDLELVKREVAALVGPDAPGLAVGVYADGKTLLTTAQGMACVEFGVPVDAHTRFDIASVSKQFTAACVMLLARDGRLSLDDDIRKHIPDLALTVPVTLRQCLQHTGGLPEWYTLQAFTGTPFTALTEERLLDEVRGIRHTAFPPGTDFSYSNTGYVLAAVVVRTVSGSSLAEFARERIFGPLGMDDTLFRDDTTLPLPRLAYGYGNADGEPKRADTLESAVGDGGVVTSVADLAPWFGFLADGRVLGDDLRRQLLEPTVLADGTALRYASGIYHTPMAGSAGYGHAGGVPGYLSNLLYLPEAGFGVAVLSNQTAVDPVRLSERLARALLGEVPGALFEPAETVDPAVEVPAGHWHDPVGDAFLTLEAAENGRVRLDRSGDVTEFALAKDGRWYGLGDADGLWLERRDGELALDSGLGARRPIVYRPCQAPGTEPMPGGAYHSEELDVRVTVRDGVLRAGRELRLPVEPAPAGVWQAGPFTLRPDGDDLLISGGGLRRMRFTGEPGGDLRG
ncbi:serine hydrolase domain-containing protein [Streptosporangium sp. NPDC020072]|uniref:serine hydrolase domain-containing protein n=1 Tax=unclassified Streptosporangium TaxID=2632669 RepID=UPI0033246529